MFVLLYFFPYRIVISKSFLGINEICGIAFHQDINCLSTHISLSMETDTISAEVILKPKNDKSLLDTEPDKVTSQNIEQFRPDLKTVGVQSINYRN